MKKAKREIDERRERLILLLKQNITSVNELAEKLNVSLPTIRRDLDYLYTSNMIEKHYGYAMITNANNMDNNIMDDFNVIKQKIARKVASYIEDNDIVFINTSSTALGAIDYIDKNNVTIITNNARVINHDYKPGINVILTGGEIRVPKYSMISDYALNVINSIHANKCIIGCDGLSSKRGMTTSNYAEAPINRAMIENCFGQTFICAAGNKIGSDSNFVICEASKTDYLVTDDSANPVELDRLEKEGVKVLFV